MLKKRVILFLMIQVIKKMFFFKQAKSEIGGKEKRRIVKSKDGFSFTKGFDGAKQLREMGKLGGKLIL